MTLLRSIQQGWSRSATPRTIEVPATGPAADHFAVFVSGDGGWAKLDREVAAALAAAGIPTLGLDALQYFWRRRTPGEAAAALAQIVARATAKRGPPPIVAIGFSRGAGVLPFMVRGLLPAQRERIELLVLLSPPRRIAFEFRVRDWFMDRDGPSSLPVRPELEALRGLPLLLFRGESDRGSVCEELPPGLGEVVTLPRGHHLARAYRQIAAHILARLGGAAEPGPGAS